MRIFGIDPGSFKTGWGIRIVSPDLNELYRFGVIKAQKKLEAIDHIRTMRILLFGLLWKYKPDTILIEWTSGKVNKQHKGGGAGLAIHGASVGALWVEAEHWLVEHNRLESPARVAQVICVAENEWTRKVPKTVRQMAVMQQWPIYAEQAKVLDPGADAADAIGMIDWWVQERRLRGEL
jgi:hypothetical protein